MLLLLLDSAEGGDEKLGGGCGGVGHLKRVGRGSSEKLAGGEEVEMLLAGGYGVREAGADGGEAIDFRGERECESDGEAEHRQDLPVWLATRNKK